MCQPERKQAPPHLKAACPSLTPQKTLACKIKGTLKMKPRQHDDSTFTLTLHHKKSKKGSTQHFFPQPDERA